MAPKSKDGCTPYIIADTYRFCPFSPAVPFFRIRTVAGGVDADIRTNKTIIPNSYLSLVQYREIEIGEEPFPYAYLLTIVAVEGLVDNNVVVADIPEQSFQDRETLRCIRRLEFIILMDDIMGRYQLFQKLRVHSRIP